RAPPLGHWCEQHRGRVVEWSREAQPFVQRLHRDDIEERVADHLLGSDEIEPVEIVVVKIQGKDGCELKRREASTQLVEVVTFDPWRAFAVGDRPPDPNRWAAVADPALSRIGQFDPAPARLQVLQDGGTLAPRKPEG